jgi:mono/diheme cytochrome c family protein
MRHAWIVAAIVATMAACTAEDQPAPAASPVVQRRADPALVARGAELYRAHCAACHGDRAQGAFAWQRPGADGKYPPPPLDASAHAWHHPYAALQQTIRQGTLHLGGGMPPLGGKLTEADIEAVIAWFQSTWPEAIFASWQDIDRRSRTGESRH